MGFFATIGWRVGKPISGCAHSSAGSFGLCQDPVSGQVVARSAGRAARQPGQEKGMMHQSGGFTPTPVAELFPAEDYQLHMRFSRGEPSVFFGTTPAHDDLV